MPMKGRNPELIIISLILTFLFSGCDKFEGGQTVPSYIQIDTIMLQTNYSVQGTANHKIVDAWVYVDDQYMGAFEMPDVFPVLFEGVHRIEIMPGIMLNGISNTRAPYPMFKPVTVNDFQLYKDSTVTINPVTAYYDNVGFIWMEDFEDPGLSITRAPQSDTGIYRSQPENAPGIFMDEFSKYSGIAYLDDTRKYFLLQSDDGNGKGFVLNRGDYIFLELNFKTTIPVTVGMFIERYNVGIEKRPLIFLNNTNVWTKIYVNFTPMVNETADALNYKVYLEAEKSTTGGTETVMFDNIKLLSRPNAR
jgi:hypothetical protein